MGIDLQRFGLPLEAMKDLPELQARVSGSSHSIGNGVSMHYSGHDKHGLAFRFFVHDEYNKLKSEATKTRENPAGIEIYDQIECKETFVDRKTRSVCRVNYKIRARYPEEYARFKEQREAPGTPLSKWGVMPSNEILTLVKDGIFTVEQFALQSQDKIQGRFPKHFFEYFTRAQQFVAAKAGNVKAKEMADKVVELQKNYAELLAKFQEMQNGSIAEPKKKAAKKKSPAKIIISSTESEGVAA